MKILHTADWHLGKALRQVSLLDDQKSVLDQIFEAVRDHNVDVLIVAGDVYDKPVPSEAAVKLFADFIERIYTQTAAAIVVISGNHDSGQRLNPFSALLDPNRILIRGILQSDEPPLVLRDEHGEVAFSGLPFAEVFAARRVFVDETIRSPHDVLSRQMDAARTAVPKGARWVVVAHGTVAGATTTESERPLSIGAVETVPSDLFERAHYAALGHLHRPQKAGRETVRYSGSPLAFNFDEAGAQKSMTVFDLGADGEVENLELIPFTPLRQVRVVKGKLADLVTKAQRKPSDDFFCALLLDEGAVVDPSAQLRPFYPNLLQVQRENPAGVNQAAAGRATSRLDDPMGVIGEFLQMVDGDAPDKATQSTIAEILDQIAMEAS